MNNASREQILFDFQECTGLENLQECIDFLEQHQWNLLNAVQAVHDQISGGNSTTSRSTVPKQPKVASPSSHRSTTTTTTTAHQPTATKKYTPPTTSSSKRNHSSDDSDDIRVIKRISGTLETRRKTVRSLNFTVEYKDHTEHIIMLEDDTVHKLQVKISERLHVPISRQRFSNWTSKTYDEHTILKDLHLPKENTIHLISAAPTISNGASRSSTSSTSAAHATNRAQRHPISPSERNSMTTASNDISITVLCADKSGKHTPYELLMKQNVTIGEIKKEIERVAHIPLRQQEWTGLGTAKDSDEFRRTSISRKEQLLVRKSETTSHQQTSVIKRDTKHTTIQRHRSDDDVMDIDPELDLEQFDDEVSTVPQYMSSSSTASSLSSNRELLIPDRCTDEVVGLEHFNRVFHARYGSTGPILYMGSLEHALQDSVSASRDERRPLAIYLHSDRSVCANVFCAQVLASETIVEYLANNYLVWAWDVTADSNRIRLLDMFKRHLGPPFAQRVFSMDKDAYPLILIFTRTHGSLELINVIEGKCTPGEVLLQLIQSHDAFAQQRERDAKEEAMREVRENLKRQQEDEYHQSLQADKAKEEARLADEQKQKQERVAHEKRQQERLREQKDSQARLPSEPAENEQGITRFKIRLPDDDGILMRRFRVKETLQALFDYLSTQGRMSGEYKLLTTYPKRDLTTLNRSDTFETLRLFPQEQLILEHV
ncbi:unnamed protein product [Adineta ricciae]|uniref:UBX domain-containing protein n=1 Tax=Adineta ricciae TaxID=249248 RepID=A0A814ITJ9_ADIRI|nr:unnamed protein product [Adineta ricciae]